MPAKRRNGPAGTARTQRMRKLECACGNIAYQSRAAMARGLMLCPCGGEMFPATLEDAAAILPPERLEEHPEHELYVRKVASVVHGQGHKGGLHHPNHQNWTPAEQTAMDYVAAQRRETARARQLASLRRGSVDPSRNPAAAPAAADMPF